MPKVLKPTSSVSIPIAWILLALAVVTALVYAPVRHFAFVSIDDPTYVSENPAVAGGLTVRAVAWAMTTGHAANWHPLTWLSHMLDVQLAGMNAGAHHVVNLVLHIVSTLLLFVVFWRMTGRKGASAFVAAMFALHPLHVESVAWVAERKDVLSTFFFMATLYAYARYSALRTLDPALRTPHLALRTPHLALRTAHFWYLAVVACFALGLTAKPMLVTLPFVLLMLDVWPLGRLNRPGVGTSGRPDVRKSVSGPERRVADVKGQGAAAVSATTSAPDFGLRTSDSGRWAVWPLVREKLPLFALAAICTLITFAVQQRGGAVSNLAVIPLGQRLANAVVAYATYGWKMLWPANLSVFYRYPDAVAVVPVVLSAAALVVVSVLVVRWRRTRPYLAVGWLWYLVTLAPVIGIVQIGRQAMADRYTYVPLIGLFVMVTWGLAGDGGGREGREGTGLKKDAVLAVAAVASILTCAAATRAQVWHWKDSTTLWQHALALDPHNYYAHNSLGTIAAATGDLQTAAARFEAAIQYAPDYPEAHNNLGLARARQGRTAAAIEEYRQALALNPALADTHSNLGIALAAAGRRAEAIAEYEAAIQLNPNRALFHDNLGKTLLGGGDVARAMAEFEGALRLDPGLASAHGNLGKALASQGRLDEAIERYTEALRLNAALVDAHNNLGVALSAKGRTQEAIAHYREALRLQPAQADVHSNLGVALAAAGSREEAVAECRQAIQLRADVAAYHYNLGFVLSGQGRTNEAIDAFGEAVRRQPGLAQAQTSLALALTADNRLAEALPHFVAAAQLQPQSDTARQYLGIALAGAGHFTEAIAELEWALRLNPGNQEATRALLMARQHTQRRPAP